MLEEIFRFELGVATLVTLATVVVPSGAFASLLTLWLGRRVRPDVRKTVLIALVAAIPWSVWLTSMIVFAYRGSNRGAPLALLILYVCAAMAGSVPAALFTRHAAVMPRGRRADDR